VNRDHAAWVGIAVLLISAGLLISQQFVIPPDDGVEGSFREWFWEHRSLDLIVQGGLIFTGALGVAALLPRDKGRTNEP